MLLVILVTLVINVIPNNFIRPAMDTSCCNHHQIPTSTFPLKNSRNICRDVPYCFVIKFDMICWASIIVIRNKYRIDTATRWQFGYDFLSARAIIILICNPCCVKTPKFRPIFFGVAFVIHTHISCVQIVALCDIIYMTAGQREMKKKGTLWYD